jgi:hypothetical protein
MQMLLYAAGSYAVLSPGSAAVLRCAMLCQVMWSIGVTALLVSSVALTGLIAYMDHFGKSTQSPACWGVTGRTALPTLSATASSDLAATVTASRSSCFPVTVKAAVCHNQWLAPAIVPSTLAVALLVLAVSICCVVLAVCCRHAYNGGAGTHR